MSKLEASSSSNTKAHDPRISTATYLIQTKHPLLGWLDEYVATERPSNQASEDDPLRLLWPAESSRSLC